MNNSEFEITRLELETLEDLVSNFRAEYDSMTDDECLYYVKKMAFFKKELNDQLIAGKISQQQHDKIYKEINIKNPIIK